MSDTTTEQDPQKAKSEAFSAAGKRLRETYREQYVAFVAEEMKDRGIDWSPKPTAAEKAASEAKALLAVHPEIAAELRALLG
jgi:hypothetical protein